MAVSIISRLFGFNKQDNQKAEDARRRVLSICNAEHINAISTFPPELLKSKDLVSDLFEAWMLENGKSYSSEEEKLRRFECFKRRLVGICVDNSSELMSRTLNIYSDLSPYEILSSVVIRR